jgi:hypothetical protein
MEMQIAVERGTETLDLVDGSCAAAPELQNGTAVSMNHTGKPPLDQGGRLAKRWWQRLGA